MFKDWLLENFSEEDLAGIGEHGVSAGWPGLTYYHETGDLYNRYRDEIWQAIVTDADEIGVSPLLFVASLSDSEVGSAEQFENLLVWYMAERTVNEVLDEKE